MPVWIQHLLVLVIVSGAFAFVAWHALRAVWGKSSRVGSCCARGCGETAKQSHAPKDPASPARVVFLPVEQLVRKR